MKLSPDGDKWTPPTPRIAVIGVLSLHLPRQRSGRHSDGCRSLGLGSEGVAQVTRTTPRISLAQAYRSARRDRVSGPTLKWLDTHVAVCIELMSIFVVVNRVSMQNHRAFFATSIRTH